LIIELLNLTIEKGLQTKLGGPTQEPGARPENGEHMTPESPKWNPVPPK